MPATTLSTLADSREFVFTVFPDLFAKEGKQHRMKWGDLCYFLCQDNPKAQTKKELPLLVGGSFGDRKTEKGSVRTDGNMTSLSFVLVDYDEGKIPISEACDRFREGGVAAFVIPTPSWTHSHPKWRAVLPLSKDVTGTEEIRKAHKNIVDFVHHLGLPVSPESRTLSQSYYFGRLPSMPSFDWKIPLGNYADHALEYEVAWQLGHHKLERQNLLRLRTILSRGLPGVHDALRTTIMMMAARGDHPKDIRLTVESWMEEWREETPRWTERFNEIARSVEGACRRVAKNPTLRRGDWQGQEDEGEDTKAKATGPAGSRFVNLGDAPEHKALEFALDGFLPTGVSVLGGAWGVGKTTNLIPFFSAVAHLNPAEWGFHPTIRRKILWLSESPDQAYALLVSLSKLEGSAPWSEFREWFHLVPSKPREPEEFVDWVEAMVSSLSFPHPDNPLFPVRPLVVVDTAMDNVILEDESSNAEVARFLSLLKVRLRGCPVVLVTHPPKALRRADFEDQTIRGAGAWEAGAEGTYFMFQDDNDNRVLGLAKRRFSPSFLEVGFGTHVDPVMIPMTPWMLPQSYSVILGVPQQSDRETREAAVRARRSEEGGERVLSAVRSLLSRGVVPSRTRVLEEVGGRAERIAPLLEGLVREGRLARAEIAQEHRTSPRSSTGFHLPGDLPPWANAPDS